MRRTIKRALLGALIGGGLAFAGATVAQAAETSGDDGVASGTQALINVTLPVTIGGNGISVLGDSSSTGATTTAPAPAPAAPAVTTGGTDGIASGTQGLVSVAVPVTVGGNAISVLGDSSSTDASAPTPAQPAAPAPAPTTSGEDAVLGGTQVAAPIQVPVTVTGNAISVLGDSQSTDATTGTTGTTGTGTEATTNGDDGIAGGTQVIAPIQAPITLGGNAISVLGDSQSTDATTGTIGTGTGTGTGTDATTNGDDGIAGGTQVIAPIGAPITAGGNAISVLGDSQSTGAMVAAPSSAGTGTPITSGTEGILGGTQLIAPIALPLTLGGNAVSVVGDSTTTGPTGPVVPTDPSDPVDPVDPVDPTDPSGPGTPGTEVPGDGPMLLALTGGTGAAPAALSVSALAMTGATPGGLWLAVLALFAGAVLVGTAALRRRTARA